MKEHITFQNLRVDSPVWWRVRIFESWSPCRLRSAVRRSASMQWWQNNTCGLHTSLVITSAHQFLLSCIFVEGRSSQKWGSKYETMLWQNSLLRKNVAKITGRHLSGRKDISGKLKTCWRKFDCQHSAGTKGLRGSGKSAQPICYKEQIARFRKSDSMQVSLPTTNSFQQAKEGEMWRNRLNNAHPTRNGMHSGFIPASSVKDTCMCCPPIWRLLRKELSEYDILNGWTCRDTCWDLGHFGSWLAPVQPVAGLQGYQAPGFLLCAPWHATTVLSTKAWTVKQSETI